MVTPSIHARELAIFAECSLGTLGGRLLYTAPRRTGEEEILAPHSVERNFATFGYGADFHSPTADIRQLVRRAWAIFDFIERVR